MQSRSAHLARVRVSRSPAEEHAVITSSKQEDRSKRKKDKRTAVWLLAASFPSGTLELVMPGCQQALMHACMSMWLCSEAETGQGQRQRRANAILETILLGHLNHAVTWILFEIWDLLCVAIEICCSLRDTLTRLLPRLGNRVACYCRHDFVWWRCSQSKGRHLSVV